MADRISADELGKRLNAEFQTLRGDKYFNRNADNLRGRAGVDDVNFARGTLAGVDNGSLPVHFRRRVEIGSGGSSRREVAKNFRGAMNFDCGENYFGRAAQTFRRRGIFIDDAA